MVRRFHAPTGRRVCVWLLSAAIGVGLASEARADASKAPTHRKGPAPKTPNPTLPEDVPLPAPNARARAIVAAGPTREQLRAGPEEETLMELRDIEATLFPRVVRGLQSGWSWDLPEADPAQTAADHQGLPLLPGERSSEVAHSKDSEWLRSLTLPDLPLRLDRRVVTYLQFYRDNDRGRPSPRSGRAGAVATCRP